MPSGAEQRHSRAGWSVKASYYDFIIMAACCVVSLAVDVGSTDSEGQWLLFTG